jgi:hypothetical protein
VAKPIIQANSYMPEVTGLPVIDINSYHSDNLEELAVDLKRQPLSKPIIVVADPAHSGGLKLGQNAADADLFARTAKSKGQHFEHLALLLDRTLEGCATKGIGWAEMSADDQLCLKKLRASASLLAPGGNLTTGKNLLGKGRIYWNGQPVTLIGFSVYGSLVSDQVDHIKWLDALSMHKPAPDGSAKGVNCTRTWLINQWSAIQEGCPGLPAVSFAGLTPFTESGAGLAERYDLTATNDAMFARLRSYVQAAWDRGIVVIVTLFDRNGLAKSSTTNYSTWDGSPWNEKNNKSAKLQTSANSAYPLDFLSSSCGGDAQVAAWHKAFVERVVAETAPYGNVIVEIMNEAESRAKPDPAWNARLPAFHAGLAATIKGLPAVCPGTPTPDPPPTGSPVAFHFPGPFTCTVANPTWHLNMPFGSRKTFRKVKVKVDLTAGPWDPTDRKIHNLLWLQTLDGGWSDMFAYINAAEGENKTRFKVNYGGGFSRDFAGTVKPGGTYRLRYEYDAGGDFLFFSLKTLAGSTVGGTVSTSGEVRMPLSNFTEKGFFLQCGSQVTAQGPEAKTIGWKFWGLDVEFVP